MPFIGGQESLSEVWGNYFDLISTVGCMERLEGSKAQNSKRVRRLWGMQRLLHEQATAVSRLLGFRTECESQWGEPTTSLPLNRIKHGELFASQKAIELTRMGRIPSDISDKYITASGSVDGRRIEPREIFCQRFRPVGEALGKMLVVSPSFGETGRDYYELANRLNHLGYDVLLMDHQWSGYSDGSLRHLDSGFGIARDFASVSAYGHRIVMRDYSDKPNAGIILMGRYLGASAGVLSAMTLNDADLLHLDSWQMPKAVNAMLVSPWLCSDIGLRRRVRHFAREASMGTHFMRAVSFLGRSLGLATRLDQEFRELAKAYVDLERLYAMIDSGVMSDGVIYVIEEGGNPIFDSNKSAWLVSRFANRGTLRVLDHHYTRDSASNDAMAYFIKALRSF